MKTVAFLATIGIGPTVTLAQVASNPTDISGWLTGSAVTVLAFGIVGFVRGWIVAGATHDRALAEIDRLNALVEVRNSENQKQVVQVLRAIDVLSKVKVLDANGDKS